MITIWVDSIMSPNDNFGFILILFFLPPFSLGSFSIPVKLPSFKFSISVQPHVDGMDTLTPSLNFNNFSQGFFFPRTIMLSDVLASVVIKLASSMVII